MAVDWEVVPERFRYLRPAVELCGETRILRYDPVLKRHISFIERATKEQLDCLASVHGEILRRGDASAIYEWCKSARHGAEEERNAAWQFGGILAALEQLADEDVSPFCDTPMGAETPSPLDEDERWRLPEDLEYLVGPALHFGERYSCELRMVHFFEEASKRECDELAALAERVRMNRDWTRILQWLNKVGARHVRYNGEINNLFNLMDLCDFKFEAE
jgi:hypothetical protein